MLQNLVLWDLKLASQLHLIVCRQSRLILSADMKTTGNIASSRLKARHPVHCCDRLQILYQGNRAADD